MKENPDGPSNPPSDLEPDRKSGDLDLLDLYLALPTKQRYEQFAGTLRAAEMAGLAQRTIQLWVECGLIRAVFVGRKYQVHLDSLWEYLRSLRDKPAS
jgi:excisionase family DNA binding protein